VRARLERTLTFNFATVGTARMQAGMEYFFNVIRLGSTTLMKAGRVHECGFLDAKRRRTRG
jgi:hypothetical protein